jgi:Ubiquitinol-cytochrome C reductase Fe-S subunit TAT signal
VTANPSAEPTRRNFLFVATVAAAAIGAVAALGPIADTDEVRIGETTFSQA